MSALFAPMNLWAACTSHKVGTLTLDCTATGPALNNPAVSGVTLQASPRNAKTAGATGNRDVRPNETVDIGSQLDKASMKINKGSVFTPEVSRANSDGTKSTGQ